MFTQIIAANCIQQALQELESIDPLISYVELRVDFLKIINIKEIKHFCQSSPVPVILTIRGQLDYGQFSGSEQDRYTLLEQLGECDAAYMDLEHHVSDTIVNSISTNQNLIRSYHHFDCTPVNLDQIYHDMQHDKIAHYKIATHANSTLDALRVHLLSRQHTNLSAHSMGADGLCSRLLAKLAHNRFIYTIDNTTTQSDKPDTFSDVPRLSTFKDYNIDIINSKASIYGLIGDPIKLSPSPAFHNQAFRQHKMNACYLPFRIAAHELTGFLAYQSLLPLAGISVTIPHKRTITALLNTPLAALNTVRWQPSLQTINTDGLGAISALEEVTRIDHQSILILGAGGTAYGITAALNQYHSHITIYNRTASHAQALAARYNTQVITQLTPDRSYDILISTLPPAAYSNHHLCKAIATIINKNTVVMDVNYQPSLSKLLKYATTNNATIVHGGRMFYHQACLQQQFWLQPEKNTL